MKMTKDEELQVLPAENVENLFGLTSHVASGRKKRNYVPALHVPLDAKYLQMFERYFSRRDARREFVTNAIEAYLYASGASLSGSGEIVVLNQAKLETDVLL